MKNNDMQRRKFLNSLFTVSAGALLAGLTLSSPAEARRGRPVSPTSVGGVRRRTRRRTRRRISRNQRLYSLPYGCSTTRMRGGVSYYYCSGIWYQPSYQGTTVIYIVHEVEAGANTEVEFEEDD
jgi:hypothetical protein